MKSVIDHLKESYIWEDVGYALRFEGQIDISKKKCAVFVISERTWYYPKNESELADIAINMLEHAKDGRPKFLKKTKAPTIGKRIEYVGLKEEPIIKYGKYEGKKVSQIPAEYLIWLYENDRCSPMIKDYVKKNLSILKMEAANAKKGIR